MLYHSPCGDLLLASDGPSLTLCDWASRATPPARALSERRERALLSHTSLETAAAQELDEYFHLRRQHFDLPLDAGGTEWQRAVWRELLLLPYGQTATYALLARRMGRPTAVRAVAGAVGQNPLSLFVPCHRVIGANGTLTGYAGGLDAKRFLLALESGH